MITVFSKWCWSSTLLPNFFSSVAFDSSKVSFLPQSNQLSTLKLLNFAPCFIIQSSASVRLYSPWLRKPCLIFDSKQLNNCSLSFILYKPTNCLLYTSPSPRDRQK